MLRRKLTESPRHLADRRPARAGAGDGGPARRARTRSWWSRSARPATRSWRSRRRSTGSRSRRADTACSWPRTTTDRSTSSHGGRKLRVAVSPAVEVDELRRGQEVMLNEALNVVRALDFERAGEVVMLKELLEARGRAGPGAGHRPRRRGARRPARRRRAAAHPRSGDSLLIDSRAAAGRTSASPSPRSRSSSSRRSPTSTTRRSAACRARSSPSTTRSSCRSCTRSCSPSTS